MTLRRVLQPPRAAVADGGGMLTPEWGEFFRDVVTRLSLDIKAKSADYTATVADEVFLVDATAGAVTVTLPSVSRLAGKSYTIKKTDASANAVTIDGDGSETIDGAATQSLASQWDSVTVVSDGSGWYIV